MSAPLCAYGPCRRATLDPSGRCQDHRGGGVAIDASGLPIPSPALLAAADLEEPTKIFFHDDGVTPSRKVWIELGRKSREDGPAAIGYYPDGSVQEEEWWLSGRRHRFGGPAETSYRDDGSISDLSWWHDGLRHREEGGPAHLALLPDGTVAYEGYYHRGMEHRIDGPAWVDHLDPTKTRFHYLSRPIMGYAEIGQQLLYASSGRDIDEEIGRSSYRVLLDEFEVTPKQIAQVLADGVGTLEGIREVLAGAPVEWVRSFEESRV